MGVNMFRGTEILLFIDFNEMHFWLKLKNTQQKMAVCASEIDILQLDSHRIFL